MPKSYAKAVAFLAAEYGSLTNVYDRCSKCPLCITRFQDKEYCPRCCIKRFHSIGTHKNAIARLLVRPLSEWVKYLWRHPEFAR